MLQHIEQQCVIDRTIRKRQPLRISEYAWTRFVPVTRRIKIVEADVLRLWRKMLPGFSVGASNIEDHARQFVTRRPKIPVFTQKREPLRMKRRLLQFLEDRSKSRNTQYSESVSESCNTLLVRS